MWTRYLDEKRLRRHWLESWWKHRSSLILLRRSEVRTVDTVSWISQFRRRFIWVVPLLLHLHESLLSHIQASIVEVEAVAGSWLLWSVRVPSAKTVEHRIRKRLGKRVAAMAIWEVISCIKRLSQAELILSVVLVILEWCHSLILLLTDIHLKFVDVVWTIVPFSRWKLILILENRSIHESKIVI